MTHPKQLPDSTIENLRQPWYASFYLIILSIGSIFHFSFLGPNFISYSFIFNLEVTLKYIHKYHSHINIRMILLSLLHVLSSASSRFLTCTGGTSNRDIFIFTPSIIYPFNPILPSTLLSDSFPSARPLSLPFPAPSALLMPVLPSLHLIHPKLNAPCLFFVAGKGRILYLIESWQGIWNHMRKGLGSSCWRKASPHASEVQIHIYW